MKICGGDMMTWNTVRGKKTCEQKPEYVTFSSRNVFTPSLPPDESMDTRYQLFHPSVHPVEFWAHGLNQLSRVTSTLVKYMFRSTRDSTSLHDRNRTTLSRKKPIARSKIQILHPCAPALFQFHHQLDSRAEKAQLSFMVP